VDLGRHRRFKGSRKSTPYAAQWAAEQARPPGREYGHAQRWMWWCAAPAPGGRPPFARWQTMGMDGDRIRDITPIPHNGVRPKKRRGRG